MNHIGLYLKKIHNRLRAEQNCALKALGVTGTQLDFLEYLYHCPDGHNTLSDLAAFFDVKHTSALHVVKILEQNHLLIREPAPTDSRCRQLLLTDTAIEIVTKNEAAIMRKEKQLTRGFSEEELNTLQQLLSRLYQNLETSDTP
ncbi:MAG: MarR family winged helix-turn-helix transcriptional regulator [Eubacteriales bacterium]|nr:MarR family winged helix-turn-helix transcriptional regulator [Eubacteriales bacterium]